MAAPSGNGSGIAVFRLEEHLGCVPATLDGSDFVFHSQVVGEPSPLRKLVDRGESGGGLVVDELIVKMERPDLAAQKEELIQQQNGFKIKLKILYKDY